MIDYDKHYLLSSGGMKKTTVDVHFIGKLIRWSGRGMKEMERDGGRCKKKYI